MNAESTSDTIAVVTPNWAIAKRSQTISYKTLQKPETAKKQKYHCIVFRLAPISDSFCHENLDFPSPICPF